MDLSKQFSYKDIAVLVLTGEKWMNGREGGLNVQEEGINHNTAIIYSKKYQQTWENIKFLKRSKNAQIAPIRCNLKCIYMHTYKENNCNTRHNKDHSGYFHIIKFICYAYILHFLKLTDES